ncbi:amidohydrolase [Rhizobium sp. LjRoot254]|uniref:amidohydrolase n=1 Tax=Rhizobium sp. LjRoot254 TaxID=3342297 RepID=UPI003ED0143C
MTQEPADLIIHNAKILSMDDAQPRAEAIAIRHNRILAVGSNDDILKFAGASTRQVDACGATVLPGFNEAHMHIFGGSVGLTELSLFGIQGFEAFARTVRDYAASKPDLALLVAQQADYSILGRNEPVTRHHLDRILPDRPFLMYAPDHHTAWANTAALKAAGILAGRDVGVGNEIVMGEDGLANGELKEADAIGPVARLSQTGGREGLGVATGRDPDSVTPEERQTDIDVIRKGLDYCASLGITSIQNMDGNLYQLEMLEEIERDGGLPARIRVPFHMKNFMPLTELREKATSWRDRFNGDRLRSDFVKMFVDGVTESGTAFFADDYADEPGWRGEPLFSAEHFNEIVTTADSLGLQIAVHAIGDGAVHMVLNGYQAASEANGQRDSRHRVEHIETALPSDFQRFAELGVVASMQPTHPPGSAGLPLEPYLSRIGEQRWPHAFAWRTLADLGVKIAFATDWPVSPLDPMYCIQCAMTRETWKEGLPDLRLSLMETLVAYTRTSAWVEFMEDRKGVLKSGYLADVVVLSGDIEAVPFDQIEMLRPVMTVCDGRISYQAGGS